MAAYDDAFSDPREDVLNQIDPDELAAGASRGIDGPTTSSSPSLSWTRKGVGDAWNAFQGTGTGHQAVGEFAKQHGLKWSGTDKVWNPEEGEWWDLSRNSSAMGGTKGVGTGHGAKAAKAKKAKAAKGSAANASVPGVQAGVEQGGGLQPQGTSFQQQLRDIIMKQLGEYQKTPSMEDPALKAQGDAYAVARQRAAEGERAALAERAAANGLLQGGQSSGGFDTDIRAIQEGAGEDIGGFNAGLVGQEVEQRRSRLQTMLSMAVETGDAESARQLQMELAKMDEALRRAQLAQQGSQFNADLAYRNRALSQQGSLAREGMDQSRYFYDDTRGYDVGRDAEEDYRWRVLYGL